MGVLQPWRVRVQDENNEPLSTQTKEFLKCQNPDEHNMLLLSRYEIWFLPYFEDWSPHWCADGCSGTSCDVYPWNPRGSPWKQHRGKGKGRMVRKFLFIKQVKIRRNASRHWRRKWGRHVGNVKSRMKLGRDETTHIQHQCQSRSSCRGTLHVLHHPPSVKLVTGANEAVRSSQQNIELTPPLYLILLHKVFTNRPTCRL